MAYVNDKKPFLDADAQWNGAVVDWADEDRTWADYGVYSTYTFDTKPA